MRIRSAHGITIASSTQNYADQAVNLSSEPWLTRRERLEFLNQDLTYTSNQLDRDIVSESQIRTVLQQFRDKVLPDAFPGRNEVPKTLIFAKDDSHADDIVRIAREVFAAGNDFCQKITYRTGFADSDEAGHAFQSEAGHLFRSEAGRSSDLMSATLRRAAAGRWDDVFFWLLGQADGSGMRRLRMLSPASSIL
jgi:hypothetical protein